VLYRPHVPEWDGHGLQMQNTDHQQLPVCRPYVGLTTLTTFSVKIINRQQKRLLLADIIFLIIIIRGKSSVVRQHRSRAVASPLHVPEQVRR
jgi:hypothetical protein